MDAAIIRLDPNTGKAALPRAALRSQNMHLFPPDVTVSPNGQLIELRPDQQARHVRMEPWNHGTMKPGSDGCLTVVRSWSFVFCLDCSRCRQLESEHSLRHVCK